jgi:cell division protein FtsB
MTGASGLLVAIAAAASLGLFYLSQSAHVAATGYEIQTLRTQLAQLHAEQQQLILTIGQARSPATIERRAREELNLVPLPQERVIFARSTKTSIDRH